MGECCFFLQPSLASLYFKSCRIYSSLGAQIHKCCSSLWKAQPSKSLPQKQTFTPCSHLLALSCSDGYPLQSLGMAHSITGGCPGSGCNPVFLLGTLNVIMSLWLFPSPSAKESQTGDSGYHHLPWLQTHTLPGCLTGNTNPRPHGLCLCHCFHLGNGFSQGSHDSLFIHASSSERPLPTASPKPVLMQDPASHSLSL